MHVIVNISLVWQRINEKKFRGYYEAAAHCRTSVKNFRKLERGEVPRLDALQRICNGLGIKEQELILGIHRGKAEPAEVVEIKKAL